MWCAICKCIHWKSSVIEDNKDGVCFIDRTYHVRAVKRIDARIRILPYHRIHSIFIQIIRNSIDRHAYRQGKHEFNFVCENEHTGQTSISVNNSLHSTAYNVNSSCKLCTSWNTHAHYPLKCYVFTFWIKVMFK